MWFYHRFALSLQGDVEDLPYKRGIAVTYETVRAWGLKFGAGYAADFRKREARAGRTWHMDEVFSHMAGQLVYFWRAVDEHGQVLDVLAQEHHDTAAAERFFRRLLTPPAGHPTGS